MSENNQAKIASTGVSGLDEILMGGLPRNHVYLIEGDPGTGKTTTGFQFLMEGVRAGERGLYISFSESLIELKGVAESHGWNLDGIQLFEVSTFDKTLKPESDYSMFHPDEVEMNEVIKLIFDEINRIEPTRIVFDSLSDMRMMARDSFRYRRQILALKKFFTEQRRSTVVFLEDKTMRHEGEHQLHSLAHGVITLNQTTLDYGAKRRRLEIVKVRGHSFVDGFHDFDIKRGGIVVYPRLVSIEHSENIAVTVASSGITELDALLGGGFETGTSNLIMGAAGTGKTSLAIQYTCAQARRGAKGRVFTFDESLTNIIGRAERLGMELRDHLSEDRIAIKQIDPAEIPPGEFVQIVRHAVEVDGVSLIVIDSLNGYLNAMPEERFLITQLHELFSFLNQKGIITLMIVSQNGLFGELVQSPIDVSYLADSVVMLRYFEYRGMVKKAISVVKKRSGEHEKSIREFMINEKGIMVGEPLYTFSGVLSGVPSFAGEGPMLQG